MTAENKVTDCPFSPEAQCSKPDTMTCAATGCHVWFGLLDNRGEDNDNH